MCQLRSHGNLSTGSGSGHKVPPVTEGMLVIDSCQERELPPGKGLFLWKATHSEIYEHHKLDSVDLKLEEEEKIQRWVNREGAVLSEPIVQNSQRTTHNEKNRKYTSQ